MFLFRELHTIFFLNAKTSFLHDARFTSRPKNDNDSVLTTSKRRNVSQNCHFCHFRYREYYNNTMFVYSLFSKANSKTWPTTEDSYKSNSVQEVLRLWWGLLCLFLWYENVWIQIWLISIFLKQKQNKNGNSNLKYEWASLSCFVWRQASGNTYSV